MGASGPGRGASGSGRGASGPGRGASGPGRGASGPGSGVSGPGRGPVLYWTSLLVHPAVESAYVLYPYVFSGELGS